MSDDVSEAATKTGIARPLNQLWALGVIVDLVALFFGRRYPLSAHAETLIDVGKLSHYHGLDFGEYVGGMLIIAVAGLLAIKVSRGLPALAAAGPVFTSAALATLFLGFMYPVNAIDIFIYASRSRLWTKYGENPIAVMPAVHPDDAWRKFASEWGTSTSPYGPLWNWVAWPVTKISGPDIEWALAGFKVLAGVSILLGAVLVYKTANTLRPNSGAAAAIVYCWNPLVLWEGAGNGHNDVVMLVPLLAAALLLARKRYPAVVPLIVVAALIKYVALLALPFAVVAIWRLDSDWTARIRNALLSLIGSLAAITFSLAPFYNLRAIHASVTTQGSIILTSPAAFAIGMLKSTYPIPTITHWSHVIGYSVFAAGSVALLAVAWLRPNRATRCWFEILFLYLLTASWTVRPWYGIWLVALAAVLPLGWVTARSLIWSIGGLASYALWIWGWQWWKGDFYHIQNYAVPMMMAPPLAIGVLELIVWAWKRRGRSLVFS